MDLYNDLPWFAGTRRKLDRKGSHQVLQSIKRVIVEHAMLESMHRDQPRINLEREPTYDRSSDRSHLLGEEACDHGRDAVVVHLCALTNQANRRDDGRAAGPPRSVRVRG